MKEILSEVREAKEKKKLKQNAAMVSSTATFTPGTTSAAKSKQKAPQHEVAEATTPAAKVESRVPLQTRQAPPSLPSTRAERGPTSPLTSPTSNTYRSMASPTSPTKSSATTGAQARPHPLATSWQPENQKATARSPTKLPQSDRGARHSPSPPVPPYNPTHPDRFPLSNKQEYQLQYKQQKHSYEAVDKEAVRNIQRNLGAESVATPPVPVEPRVGTEGHTGSVPFHKKRQGGLVATSEIGGGYVGESHTSVRGREVGKRDAELTDLAITDLAHVEEACVGLPSSGKGHHGGIINHGPKPLCISDDPLPSTSFYAISQP